MNLFPKIPKLFGLITLCMFIFSSFTLNAQSDDRYYYDNVIMVKFEETAVNNVSLSTKDNVALSGIVTVDLLNTQYNAVSMERVFRDGGKFKERREAFGLHRWYQIRFQGDTDVPVIIAAYQNDQNIEIAEAILKKTFGAEQNQPGIQWTPNDPLYPDQYNWNNTGQTGGTPGADVSAPQAWNIQTGDPGVIISVHDTGIDINHPELNPILWVNPNPDPSLNDLHGWNFANGNNNIQDANGHGSHVSGTIAAVNNNGVGVSGLAGGNGTGNGVRIMTCRVFGDGVTGGFAESYAYAADNGAVISQNSWGYTVAGNFEQAVLDGIDYFIANAGYDEFGNPVGPIEGGLVIFAAGNSGTDDQWYPAYYEPVYAVAGTNHFDRVIRNGVDGSWFGSNFGTWVDISAPGMFIISTVVSGYDTYSGTSMACPHVSAAAGLVASEYPGLTNDEVMLRILGTTDPIDHLNPGFEGKLGTGRLNAYAALIENDGEPPQAITDLAIVATGQTSFDMVWTVPDVVPGGASPMAPPALYDIRYSTTPINDDADFNNANQVANPPIPLAPGETQEYTLTGLVPLTTYYVAIKSQDLFANKSDMSNVVSETTDAAPVLGTDPEELYAEVAVDNQEVQTLTLENIGEGDLLWSIPGYEALAILNNPSIQKNTATRLASIELPKEEVDTRVGDPVVLGAGGPDDFGYTWIDSNEPGGPIFNWYEISAIGTELGALSGTWDGNTQINLPFDFKFYDQEYNSAYVSVNGWIYFGTAPSGWWTNNTIPNTAEPNNFLAVFWDDLDMRTNGAVYTYHDVDNNLFIVQWDAVPKSFDTGSSLTFQAILTPWGGVTYQYLTMTGTLNSATVGIENSDGTDGLQVVFNAAYIENNLAVKINTPKIEWLDVTPTAGTLGTGETVDLSVTYDATGLLAGIQYTGDLSIVSNDPSKPTHPVPVAMLVTGGNPLIAVSDDDVDFGTIIQGTSTSLPFTISNVGAGSALQVTDITIDNPAFSVSQTEFTILPGNDADLTIFFDAADVGVYTGTMTIYSNSTVNPEYDVNLTGEGGEAPIVSTDPTEFDKVMPAGTTDTEMLTISNYGGSDMNFELNIVSTGSSLNIAIEPSAGDFPLGKYEPSTGLPPANGEPTVTSENSGTPMPLYEDVIFYGVNAVNDSFVWFQGNQPQVLNTFGAYPGAGFSNAGDFPLNDDSFVYEIDNLGVLRSVDIATGTVTQLGIVGTGWTAMTTDPTDGTFYLSTGTGLYTLDVDGLSTTFIGSYGIDFMIGLAADGDGNLWGYSLATDMLYQINKATGAITQIGSIGFDANYGQGMTWDSNTDQLLMAAFNNATFQAEFRLVDRNTGNTQLIGVLGETTPGGLNQLGWVATPIGAMPTWLTADIMDGTIPPGGSVEIELTFDATELIGNVAYYADINVESNDPITPTHTVPVTLTTSGTPQIVVDPTTLDYGNVFVGTNKTLSVLVSNEGNAILNVTGVNVDNSAYTPDPNAFVLLPGEDKLINILFAPDAVDNFDASLTIINDDANVVVDLLGNGAPFLTVNPDGFDETLESGQMVNRTLTITNEFDDNLPFAVYIQGVDASIEPTFYPSNLSNKELLKWFDMHDPSRINQTQKNPSELSIYRDPEGQGNNGPRVSTSFPYQNLLGEMNVDGYSMDLWYDELVKFDIGTPGTVSLEAQGFTSYAGNFAHGNTNSIFMINDDNNMLVRYNIETETFSNVAVVEPDDAAEGWTDLETDYTTGELYGSTAAFGADWVSKLYTVNRFTGETEFLAEFDGYLFIAIAIDDLGRIYAHDILGDQIVKIDKATWQLTVVGPTGIDANYAQSMTFDHTTRQLLMAAYNILEPFGARNELRFVNRTTGMTSLIGKFYGDGDGEMGFLATRGEGFLSVNLLSGTLPPGVNLDLTVKFDATNLYAGEYGASIVLVGEQLEGEPSVSVPAHLTVTGAPELWVSDAQIDFEEVFVNGTSAPQYLTIRNDGTDMLNVLGVALDNDDYSFVDYSLADDVVYTLEPGEPKVFEFIFTPTSEGTIEANFTITTDGGNANVTIVGEGIPAPILYYDVEEFVHQAYPGQQQEHILTMGNIGGNPLEYEVAVGIYAVQDADVIVAVEESFESATFPPEGWTRYMQGGQGTQWVRSTARAVTGVASAFHNYNWSQYVDGWLVTPQISLGSNGILEFYDYTSFVSWYEYSGVWISTGSPNPADGDYIELMEFDNAFSAWTQRIVDLSAYAGSDVYLAFVYQGLDAHGWYIDDVLVYYESAPWLTISSEGGTLEPGAGDEMSLFVDATGLTAGTYQSGVIITSNDPVTPVAFIPFTLNVVESLVFTAFPEEGDEVVHPNEVFTMPIGISSMDDLEVMSFQFTLDFDDDLLQPIEIITEGTLSEGTLLQFNLNEPGHVSVAATEIQEDVESGGTPGLFAIEGEGVLLYVKFKAKEALGESMFTFSETLINEGIPAATGNGGEFEVAILYGDANLDVNVTAFDATIVLQDVVGLIELNDVAVIAADVSGDGNVTSFDASLILSYVVGLIDHFPVEEMLAISTENIAKAASVNEDGEPAKSVKKGKDKSKSTISSVSSASLSLQKTERGDKENLMKIPVLLQEADNVYSIQMKINYDDQLINIDRVDFELPEGWLKMYNVVDSYLNIAMAGTTPLPSSQVATIILEMLDPVEEGSISGEAIINESTPQSLEIDVKAIPYSYELSQNYPNPFNPVTTIRYQLPEPGVVSLIVYNQLGQVVKTLVNEEKDAGYHRAFWSGTNDFGHQVASGVYLFRIQAGSFVDVKKMILLK